ncbi:hypothetical protein SCHPADRAFT_897581, partial [Schizopora paradoxa]
ETPIFPTHPSPMDPVKPLKTKGYYIYSVHRAVSKSRRARSLENQSTPSREEAEDVFDGFTAALQVYQVFQRSLREFTHVEDSIGFVYDESSSTDDLPLDIPQIKIDECPSCACDDNHSDFSCRPSRCQKRRFTFVKITEHERGFTAVVENTDASIDNAEPIYVEKCTLERGTEHGGSDKPRTSTDNTVVRIVLIHCKHGFILKKGYLIISHPPSEQLEADNEIGAFILEAIGPHQLECYPDVENI